MLQLLLKIMYKLGKVWPISLLYITEASKEFKVYSFKSFTYLSPAVLQELR